MRPPSRQPSRPKKALVLATVLAAVAALAGACGSGGTIAGNSAELKWAIGIPTSWDPVTSQI
ncbi:MAG: hypothetical protein ACREJT_11330, partial [Myxococcota bacterium]